MCSTPVRASASLASVLGSIGVPWAPPALGGGSAHSVASCAATASNQRGFGRARSETSSCWRVISMIGTPPSRSRGAIGLPNRSARWSSRSHHSESTDPGLTTGRTLRILLPWPRSLRPPIARIDPPVVPELQLSSAEFSDQLVHIGAVSTRVADEHKPHDTSSQTRMGREGGNWSSLLAPPAIRFRRLSCASCLRGAKVTVGGHRTSAKRRAAPTSATYWPMARSDSGSDDAQISARNSSVRHFEEDHTKRRVGAVGPELCGSEGRFDPGATIAGRTVPWPAPSVGSGQVRRTR